MKAMVIDKIVHLSENANPLSMVELPDPEPGPEEIVIGVSVCGVCHTELDEIEGRTPPPELPMVPGHQVVGRVIQRGDRASKFSIGDRVGVAWIFSADGTCKYCRTEQENLCVNFKATGRDAFGGYAEKMAVSEAFAYAIPDNLSDAETAPLLCAGAVGYRSLKLCNLQDGQPLGLTGFGASGHLVLQAAQAKYPNSPIYVFARSADERKFAEELGAAWTGETEAEPPEPLDAIIDTTPAWKPVVEALKHLAPGGRLVINAIRKGAGDQDYLQHLSYADDLWMEREIKSVANVTRADVREFLALAGEIPLHPTVEVMPLAEANAALVHVWRGNIHGATVLKVSDQE